MAVMRMLVLGDSILWGQGLIDEHKIAIKVKKQLEARGHSVDLVSYAHSGSDVWEDGESDFEQLTPHPKPLLALGLIPSDAERFLQKLPGDAAAREAIGELPIETPFTLRQVDKAELDLGGQPIDLVLLDAGINDVNVTHITLPYSSSSDLAIRTESVGDRMHILLEHVWNTLAPKRIVVSGYYRIVSEDSHVERLIRYAAQCVAHAPALWPGLHMQLRTLRAVADFAEGRHELRSDLADKILQELFDGLRWQMVDLSRTFADGINKVLRTQVDAFNFRHQQEIARLATPTIPAKNAILTDEPWIFSLDGSLQPEDEVVAKRREAMVACKPRTPLQRFIWERASVGHPNARGAQAYVEAIMAELPPP